MEVNYGDSNKITREYLDNLLVELRQLDCCIPDTTIELFGEKFSTPIMTTAFSHLKGMHENGMVEMAHGVIGADTLMWYGYGDNQELEDIISTGVRVVKIIKPYKDRKLIYEKLKHAKQVGAFAVGMDIDHGFNKFGEDDMNGLMSGISFEELKEIISASELPFIVKGVLSRSDALKCKEAGAAGIVISHHHGIMDYAVPPLQILPEIKECVGSDIKIFVDCHIDTGSDAFKALALGADAVLVGRVILEDFKKQGAKGVTTKLNYMTKILAGYMSHCACKQLKDIDNSLIKVKK